MNRRKLLQIALAGTGAAVAGQASASALCATPTKEQTEGPFYPTNWKKYEADADMTFISGKSALAKGQLAIIKGQVIDHLTCKPVPNAEVDVWQANAFGQYFHEHDASEADLKDKNFQYRCRILTDANGHFSFKTIKPSAYPAGGDWIRPAHIHYKVSALNYNQLTTQMYFKGDFLNSKDRILNAMTHKEQDSVIVDFQEDHNKVLNGEFIISLIAQI